MPFATDLIGFFNALYTLVHKKLPHPDDLSSVMRLFYYQQHVRKAHSAVYVLRRSLFMTIECSQSVHSIVDF
jgi:hypothetical protein